ncbi:MAG: hypothetical protein ACKOWF_18615, partial [Chloroflexota bacterium]
MNQAKVGSALLGAALLAQLAAPSAPAVSAAADHLVTSAQPSALLDAQESPPSPDDEPLDQPVEQPPADQQPAEQPPADQQPAGPPASQAPEDDTELGDQGSRPVATAAPGGEPAPPAVESPVADAVPAGPVAAEPVPAGPAPVSVGDSYASGGISDSYSPGYLAAEDQWPFSSGGGSVYLNAGYGPGEANAETGYDSCEHQVTNGRAYVGIHCDAGRVVAGFTPPPWAAAPAPESGLFNGNDDFWSRVTGEGGIIKVPVPGAADAPDGTTVIEGRSRERTKTVTITRNGVSETVERAGRGNRTGSSSDTADNANDGKK